jgi:hypothetical protein
VSARGWRAIGFLLLVLGLGLRLDSSWQGLARLLIAAGVVATAAGWWGDARRAFVRPPARR